MNEHHKHHIHLLIVTYVLLAVAAPLVWAPGAHAQTGSMVCPMGYTCKPIAPAPVGCPAGYVCTPAGQAQSTAAKAGFDTSSAGFSAGATGFATYGNSFVTNSQNAYTAPTSSGWAQPTSASQPWMTKPSSMTGTGSVTVPASTLSSVCAGVAYTSTQPSRPSAVWGASTTGGTAPYTYTWTIYNDASNTGYANTHSQYLMATYATGGSKQAFVAVTDSTGASATASCYVTLPSAAASPSPAVPSPAAPSAQPSQK